jgi:hypothetical protein
MNAEAWRHIATVIACFALLAIILTMAGQQ